MSLPLFLKGTSSFDRLNRAYSDFRNDPMVERLLQEGAINSFSVVQQITGERVETTKFQHFFKGLQVVGSMSLHHRTARGARVSNALAFFDLDAKPSVSAEDAVGIAKSIQDADQDLESAPELKVLPSDSNDSARLVYWINLQAKDFAPPREVIIDAHSGEVIGNLSKDLTLAPIEVYTAKSQGLAVKLPDQDSMQLAATLMTTKRRKPAQPADSQGCQAVDLSSGEKRVFATDDDCNTALKSQCQVVDASSGRPLLIAPDNCQQAVDDSAVQSGADQASVQASQNTEKVLTYYRDHFGRDSYDAQGSKVVSVVHVGVGFDNAFWNWDGNYMAYGDGDGKELGNFTTALDVAGHEMTHGVTVHTAQLLNMGESGAVNEANSDFFGILISGEKDWVIGRGLFLDPSTAGGIRNLANPAALTVNYEDSKGRKVKKPYPATAAEEFPAPKTCDTSSNDNCWVHVNATITGHARYLVDQAIGDAAAEKLYYAVLTQYLTARTTLKSEAQNTVQACQDVLNDASACDSVRQAYQQVGLL